MLGMEPGVSAEIQMPALPAAVWRTWISRSAREERSRHAAALNAAYGRATADIIARRAGLAASLFVAFIGLACAFEYISEPGRRPVLVAVYAAEIAVCLAYAMEVRRHREAALRLSIGAAAVLGLCMSGYFAAVAHGNELLVIGLILLLAGFPVLIPWGLRGQSVLSLVALAGVALNLEAGTAGALAPHYMLLAVTTAAVLSSIGALLLDQHRFDAFRRTVELQKANAEQCEEADVSAALLRVSSMVNGSLAKPMAIFTELTEALPKILGVGWATAYLRDENRDVYRLVAITGPAGERFEELRSLDFAPESLPAFAVLERDGVIEIADAEQQTLVPVELMRRWHASRLLAAAIHRDQKPIGVLTVGDTDRRGAFSAKQARLLKGIAQQAAMALENARLMEAAREANRIKSDFVATMSHELRTPLNVILGYTDLLAEGMLGPVQPDQREALERMRRRGLQLLELITSTLNLNRLESGRDPVVLEHFSVVELFAGLQESLPQTWRKPGVELLWDNGCNHILMRSDRTKLETALRNLIHNALKYTDSGRVQVQARSTHDGRGVEFCVADSGTGIPAAHLPRVFDMFHQAHDGEARSGGVGLGLYIVQRLAQALGGAVGVESTEGVGSRFTLQLPMETPGVASEELA